MSGAGYKKKARRGAFVANLMRQVCFGGRWCDTGPCGCGRTDLHFVFAAAAAEWTKMIVVE